MTLACPRCQSECIETRSYGRKAGGAIGTVAGAASGVAGAIGGAEIGATAGRIVDPICHATQHACGFSVSAFYRGAHGLQKISTTYYVDVVAAISPLKFSFRAPTLKVISTQLSAYVRSQFRLRTYALVAPSMVGLWSIFLQSTLTRGVYATTQFPP